MIGVNLQEVSNQMIQNYGQQYVSSSPDTGSNDDDTPVEPECETIVENALQPRNMGEIILVVVECTGFVVT